MLRDLGGFRLPDGDQEIWARSQLLRVMTGNCYV